MLQPGFARAPARFAYASGSRTSVTAIAATYLTFVLAVLVWFILLFFVLLQTNRPKQNYVTLSKGPLQHSRQAMMIAMNAHRFGRRSAAFMPYYCDTITL